MNNKTNSFKKFLSILIVILIFIFFIIACTNPFLDKMLEPLFPEDCNICVVETSDATCTEPGRIIRTCAKHTLHNASLGYINATGQHSWGGDILTAPTCVAGYTTQTCERCSETRQINPTAATGQHVFLNAVCTGCSIGTELVQIPAGTLTWLLNPFNVPPNAIITLSAFKMGKFTVTQEMYQTVMGENPSYFNSNPAAGEIQGKRPVECVTWYDAIEFCNKLSELEGLTPAYTITGRNPASGYPITNAAVTANWNNNGYRLPTEAQWEYAASAGTTTIWHFGDASYQLSYYAWYSAYSTNKLTHEVGKKLPNAWGLYDMYGNVMEWCWDLYGGYPSTNQTDYTGPNSGGNRIVRGGNWDSSMEIARSAARGQGAPDYRGSDSCGLRVVRP